MQLIEILKKDSETREEIAQKYIDILWKIAPPGLGGFVDPCDYCFNRMQGENICTVQPTPEHCVQVIKSILRCYQDIPSNNTRRTITISGGELRWNS